MLWLAGSLVAGCASRDASKPPERPAGVPVSQLPESHRALIEAYGAGGETWEEARKQALLDPELERFLVENLVLEMLRAFAATTGPEPARAMHACERAQAELVRLGEASVPVLTALREISDEVSAELAFQTLERIGRPALSAALGMSDSPEAKARYRGAHLLGLLPASSDDAEIDRKLAALLARDPEWIVRAEAALVLGKRAASADERETARKALEAGLGDPDPAVSRSSARALATLGDPRAIPALIRTLEQAAREGQPQQLQACQEALCVLTGLPRPLALEGWRDWWLDHRDELRRLPR